MIPTATQTVANIIRNRLQWSVIDSDGNPAKKPEGTDELTALLICHKTGLRIVAGEPGVPLLIKIQVEGGVAHCTEIPQGCEVEITDLDDDCGPAIRYRTGSDLCQHSREELPA